MFKLALYLLLVSAGCLGQMSHGSAEYHESGPEWNSASITRPCPGQDLRCIRDYFVHNSNCQPSDRLVPEPFYREQATYYLPAFNLTTVQAGVQYRNLNGRVEDFYINKNADTVVLVITYTNVITNSSLEYYRYNRRGKEVAVTQSKSYMVFPSLSTTTIIKGAKNMKVWDSENYLSVDAMPSRLYIDPSAGKHIDPIVQRAFTAFQSNLHIAFKEASVNQGQFFAFTFIQNRICDYGIIVI